MHSSSKTTLQNNPNTAGYSGTPLAKKLGIRNDHRILVVDAPAEYKGLLTPLPVGASFTNRSLAKVDIVHVFVTQKDALAQQLISLRASLSPKIPVWISWPKKTSQIPSSLTEDTIRELALPLGFVDIKACAINDIWSGLKLVVRKELR